MENIGAFSSQRFCNRITPSFWCAVTGSRGACDVEELRTVGFVNLYSKASSLTEMKQDGIKNIKNLRSF